MNDNCGGSLFTERVQESCIEYFAGFHRRATNTLCRILFQIYGSKYCSANLPLLYYIRALGSLPREQALAKPSRLCKNQHLRFCHSHESGSKTRLGENPVYVRRVWIPAFAGMTPRWTFYTVSIPLGKAAMVYYFLRFATWRLCVRRISWILQKTHNLNLSLQILILFSQIEKIL